jgi:hypothetical protein
MDCEVNTGLGTGSRERDMAALSMVLGYQQKVIEGFGPNNPYVKPQQLGYTLQRLTEAAGMRSPDKFFSVPTDEDVAALNAPKPDPEQAKAEMEAQMASSRWSRPDGRPAATVKETAQAQADVHGEAGRDADIKRTERRTAAGGGTDAR